MFDVEAVRKVMGLKAENEALKAENVGLLEAVRQAGKWQPIDTAPLDTAILIWTGWIMIGSQKPDGFYDFDDNSIQMATHWMPLPEAPVL